MNTLTKATKIMLQGLLDNTNYCFIAKDKDGSLYAFKEMPFYDEESETYDSMADCMYLCEDTCTMLILDHNIQLDININYFENLPITTEEPLSIQSILDQ